jgi:hypothetical protein
LTPKCINCFFLICRSWNTEKHSTFIRVGVNVHVRVHSRIYTCTYQQVHMQM